VSSVYTHGRWVVKPGREHEFIEAWRELADWAMTEIPGAMGATLLRDHEQSNVFISFGPWKNAEAVEAFRSALGFRERFERLRTLVESIQLETLDRVASVS
jgi:heme-degrading monooxygenase HmoA